MIACAMQRGPCSTKPPPEPPPCPKRKWKFPWIYPLILGAFLGFVGVIYKYYLYLENSAKEREGKEVWLPRGKDRRPVHADDLPPCVQYLIIGAGAAAWGAYRAILENDAYAKIFIISREDAFPYKRSPMSKHIWWKGTAPEIEELSFTADGSLQTLYYMDCKNYMDATKFYRKKKGPAVSLAMGWCVKYIDADDHVAWLDTPLGDRPIYYERCLFAPGAKPKNLACLKRASKFVRDKLCTLRTVRDLEVAYRRVIKAKHVTIIGGGPLGCELAWYLSRISKEEPPLRENDYEYPKITYIFKDKGVLSGILPEYLGEWAAEKLRCENLNLIPQAQVYDAFKSKNGRMELTLSNGKSLETDYMFVCLGATPREEIAEESFLEIDRVNGGFLVNTEMEARTHLYVAGDAASVYSQWKNYRLRMEHNENAENQGRIAGMNMTGFWTPWNQEPHFWVKLGEDIKMEVVGEVGACMPTVALFKPCHLEIEAIQQRQKENMEKLNKKAPGEELTSPVVKKKPPEEDEEVCYKDMDEYKYRYMHGILFYFRDDIVTGIVFWNLDPIEDRLEVATEILRAKPTHEDVGVLAELLGFGKMECVSEEVNPLVKAGICIKNSKWLPYTDHDRNATNQLSEPIAPEILQSADRYE